MKVDAEEQNKKFLKSKPQDALKNILKDDKKKYQTAESNLREDIQLLDDALALYIQALQETHNRVEEWKDNESVRAAMAMADSNLHHLLLARHGVLMGYHPEVHGFMRACYERITRCLAFSRDANFAHAFLSGKNIGQNEVDRKIESIFKRESINVPIWEYLRAEYSLASSHAHPNLKSLSVRNGSPLEAELRMKVGVEHKFDMPWEPNMWKIYVSMVSMFVLLSLFFIRRARLIEKVATWDKELDRISQQTFPFWEQSYDNLPPELRAIVSNEISSQLSKFRNVRKKHRD